ncbi:chromate efflux transporter [Ectobacillus ponti]|uniref:Chromate efflux transporter n=1 Tax=Ectobacillus ponti TaxID=2961894 RepID=A0AA41XDH2_9BACI|nr:chromate efflux transporter [Ectobacillus ponti]MCP8970883.1 chromate efflux transporter [Ectobacillus ponti]
MKYWTIFWTALRLGLTSFGGPAAHIGYFRAEYVERKKWLDEKSYSDLVALANFLPGPSSSQVGIAVGTLRGGLLGGILAWLGFTLPSAAVLVIFAAWAKGVEEAGWLHSLKLVAVAVVAQAVWEMSQKLAPDRTRKTLLIGASMLLLLISSPYLQLAALIACGMIGYLVYRGSAGESTEAVVFPVSKRTGLLSLGLFGLLLVALPAWRAVSSSEWLALFDMMYRTGSLVFGGGHVVLPLLEPQLVDTGMMGKGMFLAGYGAAQAVPGPLFTFASYIGGVTKGAAGAAVATIGMFLPGFLLIIGGLPFWQTLRQHRIMRPALLGVNAGVIGILLAALYDPIFTSSVRSALDAVLALAYFALLVIWRQPPWLVVLAAVGIGLVIL